MKRSLRIKILGYFWRYGYWIAYVILLNLSKNVLSESISDPQLLLAVRLIPIPLFGAYTIVISALGCAHLIYGMTLRKTSFESGIILGKNDLYDEMRSVRIKGLILGSIFLLGGILLTVLMAV